MLNLFLIQNDMIRLVDIDTPEDCPYRKKEMGIWCGHSKNYKKYKKIIECDEDYDKFPKTCPLARIKKPKKKSDIELLQDIYDKNDMSIIVQSDFYLRGFEDGLTYKENK
jgi:hypothetical protein